MHIGHDYESHPQGEDYCTAESGEGEQCGLPESAHLQEQADRDYDHMIGLLREQLVADLAAALTHLYAAGATIRELSSSHVYDIEWAEGGGDTAAAVSMLTLAINQTHGAKAIAGAVAAR